MAFADKPPITESEEKQPLAGKTLILGSLFADD
jgi:hypothetical protein